MTDACVVLVTCATEEAAVALTTTLIEERLAACGNILPAVHSIYRWQGAVQQDTEVLVLLKTMQARVPALSARIRVLHPYDLPEVIAVPVLGGLHAYLNWIAESTQAVEDK